MSAKQTLLDELDAAREELWSLLAALDDTTVIYPGWTKREFFAHIAGWEAMVFEVFSDELAGRTPKSYGYTDLDSANARFVTVRQATTIDDAKLECEINRFAIKTRLESIDDFEREIRFPWGTETVTTFIHGAVDHEWGHAADIRKLIG